MKINKIGVLICSALLLIPVLSLSDSRIGIKLVAYSDSGIKIQEGNIYLKDHFVRMEIENNILIYNSKAQVVFSFSKDQDRAAAYERFQLEEKRKVNKPESQLEVRGVDKIEFRGWEVIEQRASLEEEDVFSIFLMDLEESGLEEGEFYALRGFLKYVAPAFKETYGFDFMRYEQLKDEMILVKQERIQEDGKNAIWAIMEIEKGISFEDSFFQLPEGVLIGPIEAPKKK